jgi:hypothetical protein
MQLTWRQSLFALALFWSVAAVFLVLWWRAARSDAQVSAARVCSEDEVFTGAPCQAIVIGTVTKIANKVVELDLEGRQASMPIEINNNVSEEYARGLARVTLYKGEPIRVEPTGRRAIDARDSPATDVENYRTFGLFFSIFPVVAVSIKGFLRWARRKPAGPARPRAESIRT